MRMLPVALLISACPALSGCLPMMAVSAASMAAQSAAGSPVSDAQLQPKARDECTARAAPYGAVHVIDVEQHRLDEIIVWGTVGDGPAKRSFECDFTNRITRFTLRSIKPAS
jgi:hypothetical protein